MPVELRKRKAPQPPPAPAPVTKKGGKVKKASVPAKQDKDKVVAPAKAAPAKAAPAKTVDEDSKAVAVGHVIDLDGFGGEVETNDGHKTSLKALVDESKSGVVLFTYPKASTPGCTNQACLFRDNYDVFAQGGLSVYGLSSDSPKANTTFKDKQTLQYTLLCDPKATLIAAIGLKKQPKGTQRGVFAVDKTGKVLLAEPGGPAATVERAKTIVEGLGK